MRLASKKTVGKRLLPLMMAVVLALLSVPATAFAQSVMAVVMADPMAVYADPGLSRQVGTLGSGEIVTVSRYSGGVAQFTYAATGGSGYARTADMQPVDTAGTATRVQLDGAHFYQQMSTSSQYKRMRAGATVYVLSTSGDWARVACNGLGGYMLLSELNGSASPAPTQQTPQNSLSGFTPVSQYATILGDMVTVYTAPDEGASSVGRLAKGTQVYVSYISADWIYLTYAGRSGFAPMRYVLPGTQVQVRDLPAAAKGQTPVYETASASAAQLTTLFAGEEVTVIAHNGSWACLRTEENVTGYAPLSALDRLSGSTAPTATPAPSQGFGDSEGVITETVPAISIANTYVYKSPSTSSENQGVLTAGKQVTVLMRNDTWAYITAGGKYGFCKLGALQPLSSATQTPSTDMSGFNKVNMTAVTVTTTSIYAQADASSQALGSVQAGAQVRVTAYNTEWAFVTSGSVQGYVPLRTILPGNNAVVRTRGGIVIRNTSVYETASGSSTVLNAVQRGDQLTVLAYTPAWAYVRLASGTEGYMSLSAVVPYEQTSAPTATPAPSVPTEGTPVTVTADQLGIYASPSTNSAYLGYVAYGTKLTMLMQNGTWAYVRNGNGGYGYCLVSGLTEDDQFGSGTPATVTVDFLTIYRSASTSSAVLGSIKRGDQVTVVDHNGTWAYVLSPSGNYGFCQLGGLTPTSQVQPDPDDDTVQYVATVVYPKAPFFQSASQDSAYVTVSAGTDVNVYKYNPSTGWGYVGIGSQRGYMLLDHLNKNSYATLAENASGAAVLVLQQELEKRGYFDGTPAGNYSSLTKTAVARFQSAVGLNATGIADQTTQRILYGGYAPDSPILSVSLSNGSTGENVTRLQTRLYYKGYLSKTSSVDGDYGSTTASAVKLFQTAAGLSATGTADANTLRALYSNNAPKNPSTAPDAGSSGGGSTGGGDSTQDHLPDNPTRAQKIEYVIYVAQQQLGKPYVYGASGTSKYDCSGLTLYCYKKVGVSLPHSAQMQGYNSGTKIEGLANMQRGDIVCMNTVSDSDLSDHVGIYMGNNKMIHASSGAGEVIISDLGSGYYNRVFSWGRRVL